MQSGIKHIIRQHTEESSFRQGDLIELSIDVRIARDFGGLQVVRHLQAHGLPIEDSSKTFFTFDCNPTGSNQKYTDNQQQCRFFAKEHQIKVYDIQQGIGTHIAMDESLVMPGNTLVSTDSHANIVGAIGAYGLGLGDIDMAGVWSRGTTWLRVPKIVGVELVGEYTANCTAKDIILYLIHQLKDMDLSHVAIELYGTPVNQWCLDQRITVASMATELGAQLIFMSPNKAIYDELGLSFQENALGDNVDEVMQIDISTCTPLIAYPNSPSDIHSIDTVEGTKIHAAFIGSCTNGRIEDLRAAAHILQHQHVHPEIVLKIVPTTDKIWNMALEEGLIAIFKQAGALVSNAGCAGCADGQVGQNGLGEVVISTGNRNFMGKQGKGRVYLASPEIVAMSAVKGYITQQLDKQVAIKEEEIVLSPIAPLVPKERHTPTLLQGAIWVLHQTDIDTDIIYPNTYLPYTNTQEMAHYAFAHYPAYKEMMTKVKKGDLLLVGPNFGSGSSRQQAVDCLQELGISCIIGSTFGAIYERNAINSGLPLVGGVPSLLFDICRDGDAVSFDLCTGIFTHLPTSTRLEIPSLSSFQLRLYKQGGLLGSI